jgi:hypothetical protein
MTRRDKKILWTGLPLFLLAVGVAGTFKILAFDAPPPDDADLLPHREPLPDDQNAYGLFEEAYARLEADLTEAQRRFVSDVVDDEYDAAKAEDALKAGKDALALWREGLQRPGLQAPPIKGPGTQMPYVYEWLSLSQLADLRALHLQQQGKHAEALDAAMDAVRFGRMLMDTKSGVVGYLIGATVEGVGLARIRRMLPDARLSADILTEAVRALQPEQPIGTHYAAAMRVEYAVLVRAVEDLKAGRAGPGSMEMENLGYEAGLSGFLLQVNRTKRGIAAYLGPRMRQASQPLAEARLPDPPGWPGRRKAAWRCAGGNGVGHLMLVLILYGTEGMFELKCEREVRIAATRLLLALKAYTQETGRLPDQLDALVPGYLDAVPRDGFNGKPFRYDREKGILYSVGLNLTDDAGKGEPYDRPEGRPEDLPDYVFQIRDGNATFERSRQPPADR